MKEHLWKVAGRTKRLLQDLQASGVSEVPKPDSLRSKETPPLPSSKEKQLEPVHRQALGCTRCRLSKGRTLVVFGEGSLDAEIVFVGEGPGQEEDRQGRPFVGAAGRVLSQLLLEVGLKRQEVYIANVVKCRPPNNRPPEPDEIAACSAYLKAQLSTIRPKVICALGKTAINALLGVEAPISSFRGKTLEWQGIPLRATYHPAYLLRNPSGRTAVLEDMKQLLLFIRA